jgi:hypothetical protein
MNFTMKNKGNLQRKYTYFGDKNEPCMLINNHASKASAFIPLDAAYKYNEPEAKDQGGLEAAWQLLRKVDQNQMLSSNPDAVILGLLRMGSDDLQFGIALGIFRMAISLGISLDNSSLFRLREYIADGLDDLLDMKPFVKERKVIAEFEAMIDGTKFSGDLAE